MSAENVAYWRKAYENLVAQTGRDLNDGLGIDPRRKDWLPPLALTPPAPMEAVAWGSCKTCNSERPSSPCWKCGGAVGPVAAGWEWPGLNDICRIRELAREVGYAVGVHGSMQRDQDLIAVPWVADAVGPLALAQHIAAGLGGQVMDYQTQDKPCGRWSCNIHTPDWTKLIDLSVMPPTHPPQPDALPGDLRERVLEAQEWIGEAECRRGCSSWRPDVHHRTHCDCGREDALQALAVSEPTPSAHPAPIKPSADSGELRAVLDEAANSFARIKDYVGGRNIDFASAFARADHGEKRARAAILDLIQSERAG